MGEQLLSMGRLVGKELSSQFSGLSQPELPGSLTATMVPSLRRFLDAGVLENITLLNSQGTVLLDATGEAVPGFKSLLLTEPQIDQLRRNLPVLLPVHAGEFGMLHQSVFIPLSKGTILQVDANPKSLEVLRRFRNFSVLLGLMGFLVSALVSLLVAQTVLKPVETVSNLAREVAKGRYPDTTTPGAQRMDELGQLEGSLLEMSAQIKAREEELSRLRQAAEVQAEQMKEVAAGIAHEVRNPLIIIRGEAEWVEKMAVHLPEAIPPLQKIQDQVKALNYLVRRFLEYGRAFHLDKEFLALEDLLKELEFALTEQARNQAVIVKIEMELLDKVEADRTLLSNSLYNLGLNALEVMPKGGILTLRLRREGLSALVEVEDTGPGFSDDVKSKLFKPFFSTKTSGSGLGLAFVHKVVSAHGGRVEAFNIPSGGAVFRLYLPISKGFS